MSQIKFNGYINVEDLKQLDNVKIQFGNLLSELCYAIDKNLSNYDPDIDERKRIGYNIEIVEEKNLLCVCGHEFSVHANPKYPYGGISLFCANCPCTEYFAG